MELEAPNCNVMFIKRCSLKHKERKDRKNEGMKERKEKEWVGTRKIGGGKRKEGCQGVTECHYTVRIRECHYTPRIVSVRYIDFVPITSMLH